MGFPKNSLEKDFYLFPGHPESYPHPEQNRAGVEEAESSGSQRSHDV
jgi:hypothetical protein